MKGFGRHELRGFVEARGTMFGLELFYLVALLTAAGAFVEGVYSLPGSIGTLPVAVPWFGALGGVIISMTGTVEHAKTWNPAFVLWHISRPLMGASMAIIGVLMMQAGLAAVSSAPSSSTIGTPGAPHNVLYYVVAFVVGYRERTFRDLIKRVVDVILAPGVTPPTQHAPVLTISPTSGPRAGGTAVLISGAQLATTSAVHFGATASQFDISADGEIHAVSPPANTPGHVTVTVVSTGSPSTATFTYTE